MILNSKIFQRFYVCNLTKGENCGLLCYIMKKGNTGMRTRILMSLKKFNDCLKDRPCAVSLYMEEKSCKC